MSYYNCIVHNLEFFHFGTKEDNRTHKVTCGPLWDFHIDGAKIKDGSDVVAEFKDGKWECNFECNRFQNGKAPFLATNVNFKIEVIACKEREEKFY